MNEADALELAREAMWTVLVVSGPAVGAAMIVGIGIALFQALTQIQEATLTFVPKIIVVLAALTVTASFIGGQIYVFTEHVYSRIEKGY
ncbi:MAG: flagellar biosynthesis protein FliQ [Methylovirgula sp.]